MWQCGDRYYSENPGAKKCKLLSSDASCGSGGNKFITKSKEGIQGSDNADSCSGFFKSSKSPFVDVEYIQAHADDKPLHNDGKKLALPKSHQNRQAGLNPKGGFTKENLDNLPLPGVAKDIIRQYMNIWASYGQVLEGVE